MTCCVPDNQSDWRNGRSCRSADWLGKTFHVRVEEKKGQGRRGPNGKASVPWRQSLRAALLAVSRAVQIAEFRKILADRCQIPEDSFDGLRPLRLVGNAFGN